MIASIIGHKSKSRMFLNVCDGQFDLKLVLTVSSDKMFKKQNKRKLKNSLLILTLARYEQKQIKFYPTLGCHLE